MITLETGFSRQFGVEIDTVAQSSFFVNFGLYKRLVSA